MPLLPAAVQLAILHCYLLQLARRTHLLVSLVSYAFSQKDLAFPSDISIWCDAGAASWGATMENQKLQAQGFFPPELWHALAHPVAH